MFADLGLTRAAEEQVKVQFAVRINRAVEELGVREAAERLGIRQSQAGALRKFQLDGFSASELVRLLEKVEQRDISADLATRIHNGIRGRRANMVGEGRKMREEQSSSD